MKRLTFLHLLKPELKQKGLDIKKAERWFKDNPFSIDLFCQKFDVRTINRFYKEIADLDISCAEIDQRIKAVWKEDEETGRKFKEIRDFWYKKTAIGLLKYCFESEKNWICPVKGDNVYRMVWFHYVISNILDRAFYHWMQNKTGETLTLSIPPQHLKSTLLCGAIPAMMLGNNSTSKGLLGAYNSDYAESLMSKDFTNVIDTVGYTKLFGKLFNCNLKESDKKKLRANSSRAPIDKGNEKTTVYNGRIFAGSLRQLTGNPADFLIVDDPIPSAFVARSDEEVKKIGQEFDASVATRIRDKTFVAVVQTRWRTKDPIGIIQQREEDLQAMGESLNLVKICLRAFYDPTDNFPYDFRTKKNEKLWEEVSNKAYLNAMLSDEMVYNASYQQKPIDSSINLVKKEWINRVNEDEIPPYFSKIIISVDTSYNDNKSSDKAAYGVFGLTSGNQYYLLDLIYDRMSFQEGVRTLDKLINRYPQYSDIVIELKANGQAIFETFRQRYPRVMEYVPTESKKARLMSISPVIQAGNLHIPEGPQGDEFVSQLISFKGEGKHEKDDLVDILVQCVKHCEKYFNPRLSVDDLSFEMSKSVYSSKNAEMSKLESNIDKKFNTLKGNLEQDNILYKFM